MNRPLRFPLLVASLLLAGWVVPAVAVLAATTPVAADRAQAESKKLHAIFDEYFEEYLQQNPLLATSIGDPRYNDRFVVGISPAAIAAEQKLQRDSWRECRPSIAPCCRPPTSCPTMCSRAAASAKSRASPSRTS